jgi:hypothetical protein
MSSALTRRCALASAELGQVVGAQPVRRAGYSHCSPRQRFDENFVQTTFFFKHWHIDKHFSLAVSRATFMNVLMSVVAILR